MGHNLSYAKGLLAPMEDVVVNAPLFATLWVLICAGEVMLMQLGFCMLETGLVRTKNSINVAVKNLADFCVAGLLFYAVGFGLMFGQSEYGLVGTSGFFLEGLETGFPVAFFIFQLVFCCTAATIISGAVAERMSFKGYIVIAAIASAIIYPLSGHWIWNASGWLYQLGFVDFAGSTAVHAVGGWMALAAVVIIGPRWGAFETGGLRKSSHSLVVATFGVIILFFGWFGFNGGSLLTFDDRVPAIILNTAIAGVAGGMVGMTLSWRLGGFPDVRDFINGILGGLVAITASCHAVTIPSAFIIGTIGGLAAFYAAVALRRWKVDDVVGAVAAHAFPGVWGTLAVAIFADPAIIDNGLGRWEQLGIQALGSAVIFTWAFGAGWIAFKLIDLNMPLRVSLDDERVGLNVAEHGASTEILDLLEEMQAHRQRGQFDQKVITDPFTEIGQIASEYNHVIERVAAEMRQRESAAERLAQERDRAEQMHLQVMDSIIYAQRIQQAALPDPAVLHEQLPHSFLVFLPRDVVSGDFFWFFRSGRTLILAVVDCTGHGVPGAFMSLIGCNLLDDCVKRQGLRSPSEILEAIDQALRSQWKATGEQGRLDGMDASICRIEPDRVVFSGASQNLYYLSAAHPGEVQTARGQRRSLGGRSQNRPRPFQETTLRRNHDLWLYLPTDGLVDQPGDRRGPFDSSRLRKLLATIYPLPPEAQAKEVTRALTEHRGSLTQRDDVTVIGCHLPAASSAKPTP